MYDNHVRDTRIRRPNSTNRFERGPARVFVIRSNPSAERELGFVIAAATYDGVCKLVVRVASRPRGSVVPESERLSRTYEP